MHGENLPDQPQDWETCPSEDVLREIGRNTQRLFEEIQCRFHAEADVESTRYPQIAAAEIVAVVAGRKPLYHELLLEDEAAVLADILRFIIPETVAIKFRNGHLVVYGMNPRHW